MAQRSTAPRRNRSARTQASRKGGGRTQAMAAFADSNRAIVVLIFFVAVALLFFGRLFYLQIIKAEEYSAQAQATRTVSYQTTARRGTIYDRNGTVLATSVDATTIYADPSAVTNPGQTATKLAEVLGGDANEYLEKLQRSNSTFVYIKRQATVEEGAKVKELDLEGIHFLADTRREYPNGSIGGQIIGYCNVDGEGITGLELQYNDVLCGTSGSYSAERAEDRSTPIAGAEGEVTAAVDGQDIIISIDIELQEYVENAIKEGMTSLEAAGGSTVIMDATTGEIYAACSLPYMNPTNMKELEEGGDQLKPVTQAFEPGSIFKTVSAMALLETETMAPEDELYCPSSITADEYTVSDAHERGDVTYTFRDIINQSSNVGIALACEKMGYETLYNYILKYGFGERTGVDYPGESAGIVNDYDTWAKITKYNVSFGHGLTVTPLQMVRFYGALVNDGMQVTPHFLISKPQTGEVVEYETKETIENKDAIPTMLDMLKTVVTDGTGTGAAIEGYQVAGKTGTAQVAKDGSYAKSLYNLSFVGVLPDTPDNECQLVCFVGANEDPYERNVTRLFSDIMSFAIERYKISPQ